jgi:5-methylcytosine-specific restriction protein A
MASLEEQFTRALLDQYKKSGEEVGYWGKRFRQAVLRSGGVATAKRMLQPRTEGQRKGLDALLEAGRPDLTTEAVILQPRFKTLFTQDELTEAARRLGEYGAEATRRIRIRERIYPDELEPGQKYYEGAKKQVRVNAYERNPKARKACLKHYGYRCVVCDVLFEERYGKLGENFIHVHHLKPLALSVAAYELNPVNDLRPVCPNCHAMLHATDPMLSIEGLREMIAS